MKSIPYIIVFLFVFNINTCISQNNIKNNTSITKEFIFDTASFKQCHASTLVELKDGSILSAWFGGSYEGAADVCIYSSLLLKDEWSKPRKIADYKVNDSISYACWNPVLFKSKKGTLFLYYKVGKNPQLWWGMYKTSNDDGKTWSEGMRLPDGFLGPIKNKPIELNDGTILCPSSVEKGDRWTVHIESTDDEGKTWLKTPIDTANDIKVIQPCILKHAKDKLQLLCRSNQNHIIQSWSYDNGKTWSKLLWSDMPNPNSGIDAVTLDNGMFMLVYNPMEAGKEWVEGRNKLNVAMSVDGINWKVIAVLDDQKEGEFSYPAIIVSRSQLVHITYTYNRKQIKHVTIDYKKLLHYPKK